MKIEDKSNRQVNLDHLYELASGDKDFIKEMIEYYLSQAPIVLEDLLKCKAKKDWQELGELAHKAKSSFKFMGIQKLTDDAKSLEEICRQQPDEQRISVLIDSIQSMMKSTSQELQGELSKIG